MVVLFVSALLVAATMVHLVFLASSDSLLGFVHLSPPGSQARSARGGPAGHDSAVPTY